MRFFHYTVGMKLESIKRSGFLKTSPEKPKPREKSLVWLSTNPVWEVTAAKAAYESSTNKQRLLSKEEMANELGGLFRFVIDSETYPDTIYPWVRLPTVARIPKIIKDRLVKRAKLAKADPMEWAGVLGVIQVERTTLEKLVNGIWEFVSMADAQVGTSTGKSTIVDGGTSMPSTIQTSDWNR